MIPQNFVVVDIDAGTTPAERTAYAAAQTVQLQQHFAPLWNGRFGRGVVRVADAVLPAAPGEIQIQLIDKPTMDGAEGYHDVLPDGTPIIYVFVGLARQYGLPWQPIASHEVLEVAGDPLLRSAWEMRDGNFWDSEVCDRVEQDSYPVNGVPLSNFNTPECFAAPTDGKGQYDYIGLSKVPNEVRPGGYAQMFDPGKGWQQVQNGSKSLYRQHMDRIGLSRAARRGATQLPVIQTKSWIRRLLQRVFG